MVFESLESATKKAKPGRNHSESSSSSDIMARMRVKDAYITNILAPFLSEQRIILNKFDLASDDPVYMDPLKARSKKSNLKTKLRQAEKFREKLQRLPEEEAEKMNKAKTWQSTLAKAKGEKVRDDPELLKKSIKKQESIKKMHKKKWGERVKKQEQVQEMMKKKKQKNIDKRKEQKKNSKRSKRG